MDEPVSCEAGRGACEGTGQADVETSVDRRGFLVQRPVHGARFDATGHWTGGQRTSSMRTLSTSYDVTTDTLTIG